GTGLERRRRPWHAARGPARGTRTRRLPRPYAPVLSLRAGGLESRAAGRKTRGAGSRRGRDRPSYGGIYRRGARPKGLGHSSSDLRPGSVRAFTNFDRGLITMINPCAVKGISIFLDVAARMPDREFGVVMGWGTTGTDRRAIARLPNVRILPNAP